ncbi:MAG: xanthine dehydrogenase family protein subunit M [Proteobacteria bacterium]|nr:xanthine dehydrogenase family protein subunit M [Pseudomonadota bacterium]NOG59536.1 xanthine dehydrogenase family protein subunit M [Pseudomonadota bacterium]
MPEFDLLLPETVEQAVSLLDKYQDKASIISGGTDVCVAMKSGYRTDFLISLAKISGLDYLEYDPSTGLRIGAKTTISQVLSSADVKTYYPALWQAASIFATPQLRNTATVIGNLLRASPAGDCICAVYALGGNIVLQGAEGQREVSVDEFWLAYGVTARKVDEIAIELNLPAPVKGNRSSFKRLTRTNEDLAKLNAAAHLEMDGKKCKQARLSIGCVAAIPMRLEKTEALLKGAEITDDLLEKIVTNVGNEISPIDDVRSTAEYRNQVAGVLIKRVITQACCKS